MSSEIQMNTICDKIAKDNREFALLQVNWQNKYESYLVHVKQL